jgi:hypothetical protein
MNLQNTELNSGCKDFWDVIMHNCVVHYKDTTFWRIMSRPPSQQISAKCENGLQYTAVLQLRLRISSWKPTVITQPVFLGEERHDRS